MAVVIAALDFANNAVNNDMGMGDGSLLTRRRTFAVGWKSVVPLERKIHLDYFLADRDG
jgi:hypothetical protein